MKKLIIALFGMSLLFTSCFDSDEEGQATITAYCTIDGSGSSMALYPDGGGIIYPESTSASYLDGYKRVYVVMSYYENDLTTNANNVPIIRNAELTSGTEIPTAEPMFQEQAESQNLLASDSIFEISSLVNYWVYKGYLNVTYNAYYYSNSGKAVAPTMNLVFDKSKSTDTDLYFTMCYNCHVPSTANVYSSTTFINSFSLTSLRYKFAQNVSDTFNIHISGEGVSEVSVEVTTDDLYLPV